MQLPSHKTLNHLQLELDHMRPDEQEPVRDLLNTIVIEGKTYPQSQPLGLEEFAASWMARDTYVVRDISAKETPDKTQTPGNVLGAFYLKPNFPGRCSHICNAGFIVQPSMRGQGIGRWMGESMLAIAPTRGYTAVMFNLIFADNTPSLNLWKSLNFSILGVIPNAVSLDNGSFVDAVMMYRNLRDVGV